MIFVVVTIVMFQNSDLDKIRNFYFPQKNELTPEELKYIPPENKGNNQNNNDNYAQYTSNLQFFNNAYQQKDYKSVISYGEKIAYRQSDDIHYLDMMGYSYLELQDYKNSIIYYKKTLAINPNDDEAKHNLNYIHEQVDEDKLNNAINNVKVGKKAPAKIYALVKTNLGNDVKEEVDGILDLVWQEINGRIILQTLLDHNIPINIAQDGERADTHWHYEGNNMIVDKIDVLPKYINDLNNPSLSPWNRIYNFNTFLHEFGHAFSRIKDPRSFNSLEEELGVSMIGYNIAYKIVTDNYMTDEQIKQQSMGTFQALLSDDHKDLPVYSGFNKRMKKYAIYMPNPAIYSDLVGMYKQLLFQGKTQHVSNLDKLIR